MLSLTRPDAFRRRAAGVSLILAPLRLLPGMIGSFLGLVLVAVAVAVAMIRMSDEEWNPARPGAGPAA
jgi:hypothetical protein